MNHIDDYDYPVNIKTQNQMTKNKLPQGTLWKQSKGTKREANESMKPPMRAHRGVAPSLEHTGPGNHLPPGRRARCVRLVPA